MCGSQRQTCLDFHNVSLRKVGRHKSLVTDTKWNQKVSKGWPQVNFFIQMYSQACNIDGNRTFHSLLLFLTSSSYNSECVQCDFHGSVVGRLTCLYRMLFWLDCYFYYEHINNLLANKILMQHLCLLDYNFITAGIFFSGSDNACHECSRVEAELCISFMCLMLFIHLFFYWVVMT